MMMTFYIASSILSIIVETFIIVTIQNNTLKILLGHGIELQERDWRDGPTHGSPPRVSFTRTVLLLSCLPSPQVFEHDPQSPYGFHSQCAF